MKPKNKYEWHSLICDCGKEPDECPKYIVTRNLYKLSEIPQSKWFLKHTFRNLNDVDNPIFQQLNVLQSNLEEVINKGVNLLIYSENCGNGKTTIMQILLTTFLDSVVDIAGFNRYGLFINTVSFLNELKQNIDQKDTEFQEIYMDMFDVPLLVLDDIGSNRTSEYNLEILYNLINHRLDCGLSTFFTSNCSEEKIRENLGERLYSRVWKNSQKVKLFGEDRRGN